MEDKEIISGSGEKRKLRPRRKVGESRSFGSGRPTYERRAYGSDRPSYDHSHDGGRRTGEDHSENRGYGRSSYGERRGEGRSYGDRKPGYGSRPSYGHSNGGERRQFNGERSSFGEGRRPFNGEHNSSGEGRRPFNGEHSSSSEGRRPFNGERKSYGGDRRPSGGSFGGNRRGNFGGERRFDGGEKHFGGDRNFGVDNRRKPYGAGKAGFGAKKSISRKQYNDYSHFRDEEESGISRMIDNRRQADTPAFIPELAPAALRGEVRLNKFIANSGICSRREADNFIQAGVVTVNGVPVTELGTKINADVDDIRFNGERLKGEEKVYIVMNKPKGFVTTTTDPHAEKTVMDLLRRCTKRVFPVGRLDKNTTGVLLFTNDGEIAEKLTHPSFDKKKIYQVSLDHALTEEDREKILQGVTLSDGDTSADSLEFIEDDDHRKVGIEIHSGKNRIVRRIFESLGYDVKALDRVYFAGLTKKSLKRGEWRVLNDAEVNALRMGSYL